MRDTVKYWKTDWIETNGETNEIEVIIKDHKDKYIYEGSFAGIPVELEEKKVIDCGKILDSTVPARIGAYTLTVETDLLEGE